MSLNQHIEDIAAAVSQSTAPVVLAGHSYAGMIISGVAEQVAGQIDSLLYVDAFLPEDGQSALDLAPAAVGGHIRQKARDHGEGWRLPGGPAELDFWGLAPGPARDFAQARLCDFTLRCVRPHWPPSWPLRKTGAPCPLTPSGAGLPITSHRRLLPAICPGRPSATRSADGSRRLSPKRP